MNDNQEGEFKKRIYGMHSSDCYYYETKIGQQSALDLVDEAKKEFYSIFKILAEEINIPIEDIDIVEHVFPDYSVEISDWFVKWFGEK